MRPASGPVWIMTSLRVAVQARRQEHRITATAKKGEILCILAELFFKGFYLFFDGPFIFIIFVVL